MNGDITAKRIELNERRKQLEIDEKDLRFQESGLTVLQDTVSKLRNPGYVLNLIGDDVLPSIFTKLYWKAEFSGTHIEGYEIMIQKHYTVYEIYVIDKKDFRCCCFYNCVLCRYCNCLEDCFDYIADWCEKGINNV